MSGELVAIYIINIQVYTHLYIGQKQGVHTSFYNPTENYIIYSVKTIATLLIAITLNFNITSLILINIYDALPLNHA